MRKSWMYLAVCCIMLCCLTMAAAEDALQTDGDTGHPIFTYRYADAAEAAGLLLSNRDYYEGLTQNDLNYRMQHLNATLGELEAYIPEQMLEFTDEEKRYIDAVMAGIEAICAERAYALPVTDGIVLVKTTMREECNVSAYTHGTQIYLGQRILPDMAGIEAGKDRNFREIMAHELFHCLTRNHPVFRSKLYEILGFTVAEEEYEFDPGIRERIISNPDVEHHNAFAAFEIHGEMRNCVVIFTTSEPFRQPGDSFVRSMETGLVPTDDLSVMYTLDDAANFWQVFGRNTDYVVDPEETMADNFSYVIIYGTEGREYPTPEIIQSIDAMLREAPWKNP